MKEQEDQLVCASCNKKLAFDSTTLFGSCSHNTCKECVTKAINGDKIPCPADGCGKDLSLDALEIGIILNKPAEKANNAEAERKTNLPEPIIQVKKSN